MGQPDERDRVVAWGANGSTTAELARRLELGQGGRVPTGLVYLEP